MSTILLLLLTFKPRINYETKSVTPGALVFLQLDRHHGFAFNVWYFSWQINLESSCAIEPTYVFLHLHTVKHFSFHTYSKLQKIASPRILQKTFMQNSLYYNRWSQAEKWWSQVESWFEYISHKYTSPQTFIAVV